VSSNLKVLGGSSSHHLQGAGHIVAAPLQVAQLVLVETTTLFDETLYETATARILSAELFMSV